MYATALIVNISGLKSVNFRSSTLEHKVVQLYNPSKDIISSIADIFLLIESTHVNLLFGNFIARGNKGNHHHVPISHIFRPSSGIIFDNSKLSNMCFL